jgi:hypothetical protein
LEFSFFNSAGNFRKIRPAIAISGETGRILDTLLLKAYSPLYFTVNALMGMLMYYPLKNFFNCTDIAIYEPE